MSYYVFYAALCIMFASLAGAVFTARVLHEWVTSRLRFLIALAAGVFVVVIFNLVAEVVHEGLSSLTIGAFVLGAVLLELVTRLLPKDTHHHHGLHPEHGHHTIDARRMLVGDAVHNIHDGITLTPAFLVSPVVGLGTAAGIFLHELVQGISEFFVLREAGYSTKKALAWNFFVNSSILIGVILAMMLVSVEGLSLALVAFSAGGFSYILGRDLLPSIVGHARMEQKISVYLLAFLSGLILMASVTILVPHSEVHEEEFLIPEGFGLV